MFNEILKKKLEEALGGNSKITIEIDPVGAKDKEDDELKKEGLAPSNPKKDAEIKGKKMELEAEVPMEDDEEMLAASLMDDDEQEELATMPGKAKGLFGKMKQGVAKNLAKKEKAEQA